MRLETIRRHQRWMMWILVAITIIVFGLFGTFSAISDLLVSGGTEIVGYYRGKPITGSEYTKFASRWVRYWRNFSSPREKEARSFFLMNLVLLREAKAAGIGVSSDELDDAIAKELQRYIMREAKRRGGSIPEDEIVIDRNTYERFLKDIGMSAAAFEKTMEEVLIIQKYRELMFSSLQVSEPEIRIMAEKDSTKVRVRYLDFVSDEFTELTSPTEEDVRRFFEENATGPDPALRKKAGRYYQPDRVAIEYVYVNYQDFEPEVEVSYDDVERYYWRHRSEYARNPREVKKGKTPFKSLSEVYKEIEDKKREEKAASAARDTLRRLQREWIKLVTEDTPQEEVNAALQKLAEKYRVHYWGKTRPFGPRELTEEKVGPIRNAPRQELIREAFCVYEWAAGKDAIEIEKAFFRLSNLIPGKDSCYLLRVFSQQLGYSPKWSDVLNGRIPGISPGDVKFHLKQEKGFQEAKKQAINFRVSMYKAVLWRLANLLDCQVEEHKVTRANAGDELGKGANEISDVAFRDSTYRQVSTPFKAGGKACLVLVTRADGEERELSLLRVAPNALKSISFTPRKYLLEPYYDAVKERYKRPGDVEVEFLLAKVDKFVDKVRLTDDEIKTYYTGKMATYKSPDGRKPALAEIRDRIVRELKRTRAAELAEKALKKALEDPLLKPLDEKTAPKWKTEEEKAEEKKKINHLAKKFGLEYAKDRDPFRPDREQTREAALGALAKSPDIEEVLTKQPLYSWSKLRKSSLGPYILRVVYRGAPVIQPFDEVDARVRKDYLRTWKAWSPEFQLGQLWEQELIEMIDNVRIAELPPIPVKERQSFQAFETGYYAKGSPPPELDFGPVRSALATLALGQVSQVIETEEGAFILMPTDERKVRIVKVAYAKVPLADFEPSKKDISEKEIENYYKTHSDELRSGPAVALECVIADLELLKKEAESALKESDLKMYYEKNKTRLYGGKGFDKVKVQVKADLAYEKARGKAKELIANAHKEARRSLDPDLEQIAKKHGLTCVRPVFTREEGKRLEYAKMGALSGVLAKAFEMKDGELTRVHASPTSYFFFRRLKVQASRLPPLEKVRSKILEQLQAKKTQEAAERWVKRVLGTARKLGLKKAVDDATYAKGRTRPVVREAGPFSEYEGAEDELSVSFRKKAAETPKREGVGPVREGEFLCFGMVIDDAVEVQRNVLFAKYGLEAFQAEGSAITNERLQAAYKKHKEEFRTPDQVRLEYLLGSIPEVANSDAVKARATDAVLHAYYEKVKQKRFLVPGSEKQPRYRSFEEVKAEVSNAVRNELAEKLVDERILAALSRIRKSKTPGKLDLEAIARELGLQYGLTGFFTKTISGTTAQELKDLQEIKDIVNIAFSMKDGEVLADDRLRTLNFRALVRRKDFRPSRITGFEDVKERVKEIALRELRKESAKAYAEKTRQAILAQVKGRAEVETKAGVFRKVVAESERVYDSWFVPSAGETDYFTRPMFRPDTGAYMMLGASNLPASAGPRFALAAFELPRGLISDPISEADDNTHCWLLLLSGLQRVTEDDINITRIYARKRALYIKSTMMSDALNYRIQRLMRPPK